MLKNTDVLSLVRNAAWSDLDALLHVKDMHDQLSAEKTNYGVPLKREVSDTLLEAKVLTERRRQHYTTIPSHSALVH